ASSLSRRTSARGAAAASTARRWSSCAIRPERPRKRCYGTPMGYQPGTGREVRLRIDGMHCASCAPRVERGLNRVEGVTASVNYLTEQATVRCPPDVAVERLVGAVESAGYTAHEASEHA